MKTPSSTDQHYWVSWQDYDRLVEQLVVKVHESGWEFDQILCLARGGLRPGDVLSRVFDVPLAILSTSSYREAAGTQQGKLDIGNQITMASGRLRGRLLLVDDLVDSGDTLSQVIHHLRADFPDITEIRSAVIWHKSCSVIVPDFAVSFLSHSPWIHQPFECYDNMAVQQLVANLAEGVQAGHSSK